MLQEMEIAGVTYNIKWVNKAILDEGKEHWAVIDAEHRKITIYNGLSEKDTKHILTHEACHEILDMLGIDMDETIIKLFIRQLFDTLYRNRIFTKEVK